MYGKLFQSMYDGTLVEDWRALVTFQQMIILSDRDGVVDITPQALSRRTGIPIELIEAGLEALERADPYSRTPDEEGRRIRRLDDHRPWGWYIVNHEKYKKQRDYDEVRNQNRERKQRQRKREKSNGHAISQDVTHVTEGHDKSRHIDIDIDIDIDIENDVGGNSKQVYAARVPVKQIVEKWNSFAQGHGLPQVVKRTVALDGQIRQRWNDDIHTLDQWSNFFDYIGSSKFLTGKTEPRNGNKPFRATLQWITKVSNYAKIAAGEYHE